MHAKPKSQSPVQTTQSTDQINSLDLSGLTFDQAEQIIEERNRRREIYGRPQSTINVTFGDSGRNAYARANSDPNAVIYGDLPNSFWAKLLSFLEDSSNDPTSYTSRRDAVLMCEAIRQKLRERGF